MFIGEFQTSVTSGNRIAIPKAFRNQLSEQELIVTRGYEGCIVLIASSNFEKLLDGVLEAPFIATDRREVSRFLLAGAHSVVADSQGRMVVPGSLSEYADLESGKVVILGVGTWIEIWDEAKWKEYSEQMNRDAANIAERLTQINNKNNEK